MASKTSLGNGAQKHPPITVFRQSAASTSPPGVQLDELLYDMEPEIRCLARGNIAVQIGSPLQQPSPTVALPEAEAQDLIRHLVIDACDAMPTGGTLCLNIGLIIVDPAQPHAYPELSPGRYIALSVRDTGNGANANVIEAFGSSRSTSLLKKGRALGLSAGYEAIQHGDGCLAVSRRNQETVIRIYFPCVESSKPA